MSSRESTRFTLSCTTCGYDLRGQRGEVRVCPECGTTNRVADCARTRFRPVPRVWSNLAMAAAAAGLALVGGFHILLALNGVRTLDLLGPGLNFFGTARPNIHPFANLGTVVAIVGFYLALASGLYGLVLAIIALWRRDKRTVLIVAICAALTLSCGLMAIRLGLIIAGI